MASSWVAPIWSWRKVTSALKTFWRIAVECSHWLKSELVFSVFKCPITWEPVQGAGTADCTNNSNCLKRSWATSHGWSSTTVVHISLRFRGPSSWHCVSEKRCQELSTWNLHHWLSFLNFKVGLSTWCMMSLVRNNLPKKTACSSLQLYVFINQFTASEASNG